jgi:hypothetical protein
MKVGDRVRIVGIPDQLPAGDHKLPTKTVFESCLNRDFEIQSFNEIGWAELIVESATGSPGETIWIEPQFLAPLYTS